MEKLQRIFLTGFMGCGKTTHGKKLAKLIGYPFIDLDHYIEKKEERLIGQIFLKEGEDEFRKKESFYLGQVISRYQKAVFSVGGGTACFNDNMQRMLEAGLVIYVSMPAEALHNRLMQAKKERPLLAGKSGQEALDAIRALLEAREPFYRQANITVDGINLTGDKLKEAVSLFVAGS